MLDHQPGPPASTPTVPVTSYEVSLAPREGDLLSLPFDQYGRMRVVQNLAHILYRSLIPETLAAEHPRIRVLDVGGYPGTLRHFLAPDLFELTVLDVVPDDGTIPGYVKASGASIPFGDGEFDVVVSLDTLEHIPGHQRPAFLNEAMRVARHGVVLVNPVQSTEADLSEELLGEYIRWLLDAQQEQLAEHRAFGLPDFGATVSAFVQSGMPTYGFGLANIHNWLFMMVAKHHLIALRDERASGFERTLDRYYNLTFSESDRTPPNYRGALVAVRPGLEQALEEVRRAYPAISEPDRSETAIRLQMTELLLNLLNLKTANHEDRLLREQIANRDKHIAQLEQKSALQDVELDRRDVANRSMRDEIETLNAHVGNIQAAFNKEFESQKAYIARLESDVMSKDEHIAYLERLLQGIESGRVFRTTRAISRFLGR